MSKKKPLHERWRDYTEEEINDIKRNVCIAHECPYFSALFDGQGTSKEDIARTPGGRYCDYICLTGKPRGCMPDQCTKWKDRDRVVKRQNAYGARYVIELKED